jgi:hypothetical protein
VAGIGKFGKVWVPSRHSFYLEGQLKWFISLKGTSSNVSKGHCYANAATVAADYIAYFPINALEARPSNFQNKPEGAIN